MIVTLVSPQSCRPNVVLTKREDYSLSPPLGLLYLAAGVAGHHDVHIIDGQLQNLTLNSLVEEILSTRPDIVGISMNYTTLMYNAQQIAQELKRKQPELLVVTGGNCATFLFSMFCRPGCFDAVFLREADTTFPAFVNAVKSRNHWSTPGIAFHQNGHVMVNSSPRYVDDLDSLPWPRYDLLPGRERYLASVMSSRGCSFNCIYCSTKQMWYRWRFRSPENVLSEIDWLYHLGFKKTLAFSDDEFVADRRRVMDIANRLFEKRYEFKWGFAGRIELIDPELLEAVGSAGCRQIFFGIESGSDPVRRRLKRKFSVEEVEHIIDLCIAHGIIPIASFMVGIPFETYEDACRTLELMQRINTYRVQLSVFTPFVGTPVYQDPDKYGIHLNAKAHHHVKINIDVGTIVHSTPYLSEEEIQELWFDGQGIIMKRYQERDRYETKREKIRKDRYPF